MKSWPVKPFLGITLLILTFHAVRGAMRHGYSLGLGSLVEPTPLYGRFLALWMFFGGAAALIGAVGLSRHLARPDQRGLGPHLLELWTHGSDRKWVVYGSLFALLIPALLRQYVLLGMPVTDDESAYQWMGEILSRGRLYLESPAHKLFFDNRFLINDGKFYSQYFIGWPVLMAPGFLLGVAGFMNALYAALAVPPLFLTLRRLIGQGWARAGLVVYLTSPMLMVGAATGLSHTSCLTALAYFFWFVLVARERLETGERPVSGWIHAGASLSFCVAFFIRPVSALGIGLPLLVVWLLSFSKPEKRRALIAFALPAVTLAALFLAVNQIQNGSPFAVGYAKYYEYAKANGFRFSVWTEAADVAVRNFDFTDLSGSVATSALGIYRFGFAFLGWPCWLLVLALARGREARWLWLSCLSFLLFHFFIKTVGVDAFAPVHYFELALPAFLLTLLGLASLHRHLDSMARIEPGWRALAPSLLASLVVVSLVGYVPVRLQEVRRLAEAVVMPFEALETAGIERGVIFASSPFISSCRSRPSAPLVFARPNNDPDLANDILWVNHISLEADRNLMEEFPGRRGYVMAWLRSCEVVFSPLDLLSPGSVPPAHFPAAGQDLPFDR